MHIYMYMVWVVIIKMGVAEEWWNHMGEEYFFSNNTANWNASRERCLLMAADLPNIRNSDEHRFLSEKITNHMSGNTEDYWIGLVTKTANDICRTNTMLLNCSECDKQHPCCQARVQWSWTDNTPMDFMHWMVNEPSDNNSCGRIARSNISELDGHYWYESACANMYRYICKRTLPTSLSTSLFVSPSSAESASNNTSFNRTAIAAGVAVAACLLLAVAILVIVWLIRRRREKQALAKTHVTILPVDEPHAQDTLENNSKTGGPAYINKSAPKATYVSKTIRADHTNNNTEKVGFNEPVPQTTYTDIQFSVAQRQPESPDRDVRAAKALHQQVEYADLSFASPDNKPVQAENKIEDGYAEVHAQQGVMEYASAYDVTAVHTTPSTETYANITKPAKPKLAVKPQPQNTHNDKETTPPPSDVDAELPQYSVVMKKKKS